MGEAKRRNTEGRRLADELGRRLRGGEFGAAGQERYLVVLDKSERGRGLLAALRAGPPPGLGDLLAAEPVRLWEASSLFPFLVLTSGAGTAEQRSLLAGSLERLLRDTLGRARRRLAPQEVPVGLLCGLEPAVREAVESLLQGGAPDARR